VLHQTIIPSQNIQICLRRYTKICKFCTFTKSWLTRGLLTVIVTSEIFRFLFLRIFPLFFLFTVQCGRLSIHYGITNIRYCIISYQLPLTKYITSSNSLVMIQANVFKTVHYGLNQVHPHLHQKKPLCITTACFTGFLLSNRQNIKTMKERNRIIQTEKPK